MPKRPLDNRAASLDASPICNSSSAKAPSAASASSNKKAKLDVVITVDMLVNVLEVSKKEATMVLKMLHKEPYEIKTLKDFMTVGQFETFTSTEGLGLHLGLNMVKMSMLRAFYNSQGMVSFELWR